MPEGEKPGRFWLHRNRINLLPPADYSAGGSFVRIKRRLGHYWWMHLGTAERYVIDAAGFA